MEHATGLAALGVDAKLIIAQIVNFTIVFLLLKFFALKPVLAVLAERRKRIRESIKNAELIERQKQELEEKTRELMAKANTQAEQIIGQARQQASEIKRQTDERLNREQEKMIAAAKQEISSQMDQAIEQGKKQLGYLAVKISEKLLREKIGVKQNEKLLERGLKELA